MFQFIMYSLLLALLCYLTKKKKMVNKATQTTMKRKQCVCPSLSIFKKFLPKHFSRPKKTDDFYPWLETNLIKKGYVVTYSPELDESQND